MQGRSDQAPWCAEPDPRIRVLVECEPDSCRSSIAAAIESHGYSVRTCEGPGRGGCHILENGACALVDGADVVVNLLEGTATGARIRDAVAGIRRPPAVVADVPSPQLPHESSEKRATPNVGTDRITALESPFDMNTLIAAIEEALVRHDRPIPIWGDGFC